MTQPIDETELRKDFTENWGKKCKEFDPDCPACIAWKFYERSGSRYMLELTTQAVTAALKRVDEGLPEKLDYLKALSGAIEFKEKDVELENFDKGFNKALVYAHQSITNELSKWRPE